METIGLFQLENLVLSRSPFQFIDVRVQESASPPEPIFSYLKVAVKVTPENIRAHLRVADKNRPVLLIGQDEREAAVVACDLEAAGFTNVYIIAGGVDGLVSEL